MYNNIMKRRNARIKIKSELAHLPSPDFPALVLFLLPFFSAQKNCSLLLRPSRVHKSWKIIH